MIRLLRVDERMIHGQVAVGWSKLLKINGIVVANNKASNDKLIKASLKMAAPQGIKVSISTIDAAIKLLNDPRCENMSILLIVDNLEDALIMAKNIPGIPEINIGNYGRIKHDNKAKKALIQSVYVTEDDMLVLHDIALTKIPCNLQMTSSDQKINLEKFL